MKGIAESFQNIFSFKLSRAGHLLPRTLSTHTDPICSVKLCHEGGRKRNRQKEPSFPEIRETTQRKNAIMIMLNICCQITAGSPVLGKGR
jgi:hypothetical protein